MFLESQNKSVARLMAVVKKFLKLPHDSLVN